MSQSPILEIRGLTKRFPGVLANDAVDLTLNKGEIIALLGENGAGKTTLMNMLYGLYQPDEGEILFNGSPLVMDSPNDAIAAGIGMVHQHFMLIPVMTVTENIMLGVEQTRGPLPGLLGKYFGRIDRRSVAKEIKELSQKYNLSLNPDDYIKDLPVGIQQRAEIIKALYRGAEILILDEPTAVLTPQEAEELFTIMKRLTNQGVSIIFITHKLKEVLRIADRIAVLHRGRLVGTTSPAEADEAKLAEMMVGRQVILKVNKKPAKPQAPILQVTNLSVNDDRGQTSVNNTSLTVHAGEILGIAGVQGNGQRELIESITGLRLPTQGSISLNGHDITTLSPRPITEMGVAHIPEDREKHGFIHSYTIADNLVLNQYYQPPYAQGARLQFENIDKHAQKMVDAFDVRTPSIYTPTGTLSGGNKQKVIIARELSRPLKLLIANQPTRGVDVGSIEFIHNQIIAQRDEGVAVLLISAELDEILNLADRVAVMFDGQIIKTLPIAEATRERIGLLMAGSSD
ncbi:MAG TPA: ABC transporter ATP-binding protein [Anaerolineae bacterium]|nr:ABC transporter ATP-binding protein [Anaerolineae bacterium]